MKRERDAFEICGDDEREAEGEFFLETSSYVEEQ